jgi:hypothetical protein
VDNFALSVLEHFDVSVPESQEIGAILVVGLVGRNDPPHPLYAQQQNWECPAGGTDK